MRVRGNVHDPGSVVLLCDVLLLHRRMPALQCIMVSTENSAMVGYEYEWVAFVAHCASGV